MLWCPLVMMTSRNFALIETMKYEKGAKTEMGGSYCSLSTGGSREASLFCSASFNLLSIF